MLRKRACHNPNENLGSNYPKIVYTLKCWIALFCFLQWFSEMFISWKLDVRFRQIKGFQNGLFSEPFPKINKFSTGCQTAFLAKIHSFYNPQLIQCEHHLRSTFYNGMHFLENQDQLETK